MELLLPQSSWKCVVSGVVASLLMTRECVGVNDATVAWARGCST